MLQPSGSCALVPLAPSAIDALLRRSIEEATAEQVRAGLTEEEARRAVDETHRRLFGSGVEQRFRGIVELDGGRMLGDVWFGQVPGLPPTDWYLLDIWIETEHRGRGIAAMAIELVLREVAGVGAQRLGLTVYDDNPVAGRLYERLGFVTARTGDGRREMWKPVGPSHGA